MIFLLPPSESKQSGGTLAPNKLSFSSLASTQAEIQEALILVSKDSKAGVAALKLGPKQLDELAVNLALTNPTIMPAIDRYTGVLYDALKLGGLSKRQRSFAGEIMFIQSSLFGLISALDQIPNYRLSAAAKLPGLDLRELWNLAHESVWERFRGETVIDLRSKAYARLAPIPEWIDSYQVEVLAQDDRGTRRALNHFNKQAKGSFARASISLDTKPDKPQDLRKISRLAGLDFEIVDGALLLITHT